MRKTCRMPRGSSDPFVLLASSSPPSFVVDTADVAAGRLNILQSEGVCETAGAWGSRGASKVLQGDQGAEKGLVHTVQCTQYSVWYVAYGIRCTVYDTL